MAKAKGKKGPTGGVNSHIRSRLSFLHQAATFLQSATISSNQQPTGHLQPDTNSQNLPQPTPVPHPMHYGVVPAQKPDSADAAAKSTGPLTPLSRVHISHMRGVSLKTQLRLPVEVKRSFCKRCDTLLLPNVNSTEEIRNPSRGRKKPWADVRVVRCDTCGTEKHFPQTDRRSRKLSERQKASDQTEQPSAVG